MICLVTKYIVCNYPYVSNYMYNNNNRDNNNNNNNNNNCPLIFWFIVVVAAVAVHDVLLFSFPLFSVFVCCCC